MKNIMVIINPKSGNESGHKLTDFIQNHLEKFFEQVVIKETHSAEDPVTFGKEAGDKKFESVMIVGGDGTVNGVVKGFKDCEHRPKIAIVPAGTGNLLARELGVSNIKKRAILSYEFKKTRAMNLGLCNDDVFNMFASLGPIPDAIHEVTNEQKTALGFFAYVFSSMSKLASSEVQNIKVKANGLSFNGSADHLLVSLVNGIGLLKFSELEQSIVEGNANIFIQKSNAFIERAQTVTSAIGGKMEESDSMISMSANKISIENLNGPDLHLDLDGEMGPKLPVTIKVLKDFNEFYLPENTAWIQ